MEEGEVKEETGSCLCHLEVHIKKDFHRGPVVKNLPCNAEDASWIPGQRTKIPHVRGQLNWLQLEKPTCCNKDPAQPDERETKRGSGHTYTNG